MRACAKSTPRAHTSAPAVHRHCLCHVSGCAQCTLPPSQSVRLHGFDSATLAPLQNGPAGLGGLGSLPVRQPAQLCSAFHLPYLSHAINRCFGRCAMGRRVVSTTGAGTLVSNVCQGPARDVDCTTPSLGAWRSPQPSVVRAPTKPDSGTQTCSRSTSSSRSCALSTTVFWTDDLNSKDIVSCCFATTPLSSSSFARGQVIRHS